MDYQMSEDNPEGAAAMLNNQQNPARCPYRSTTDGASGSGSASSQHNWTHNPHFHAGHMAGMPMYPPYASPNAYWARNQAVQQAPQASRQPFVSHHARSSGSSTNSEYGSQENRSHGQAQIHNQGRDQHTEEHRPPMPRNFSSPERFGTNRDGQGGQQNGQSHTPSSTSSPTHHSPHSHPWAINPYVMDNTGRYNPHLQFLSRPQFHLQQTSQGQQHPRQLPQPNLSTPASATGSYLSRNNQMSQNGQPQIPFHGAFGMSNSNIPPQIMAAHDRQHRAVLEAAVASPAPENDDSDDDSEADDDDDVDTDSSPPRAYTRGAAGPAFTSPEERDAYLRIQEAAVMRERQRAARRAQLHNVKSIADPSYVACLEKVDLETLTGEELTCMICYNDFGVKNPDGQTEAAVRLGKCKHILGESCLKKWFEDSDSCPYCRDKVPSIQKSRVRLIARYAAMTEAQRAAGGAYLYNDPRGDYTQYVEAAVGRAVGGGGELPRHYATRAELDERIEELRAGQDRHAIAEHGERYERPHHQRRDENIASNAPLEHGVSVYAAQRPLPQTERRRQARIRTANRGAFNISVNVSAGSTASGGANPGASAEMIRTGLFLGQTGVRGPSVSSPRGNHSANSSWDSNSSSEAGPRSITPHPTVLDNLSNHSPGNTSLNPAAPAWNGSLLRQSQQNQPQPTNPPAPNSPTRALFGYHYGPNRFGAPPTTASATNPDSWRPSTGVAHTNGNSNTNSNNGTENVNVNGHGHGHMVVEGGPGPAWNTAQAGAAGTLLGTAAVAHVLPSGLYNFEGIPGDELSAEWNARVAMASENAEMDVEMADLEDASF